MKRTYSTAEASGIAEKLGIDFRKREFDIDQFRAGLDVEAEHGASDPATNVTDDDPVATGKIALAHLNEIPDYYTRLAKMETEGQAAINARRKAKRGLFGRVLPLAMVVAAFLAVRAWSQRRGQVEPVTNGSVSSTAGT